jgi:hypothetical protein
MARNLHKVQVRLNERGQAFLASIAGAQMGELRNRISLERTPIVGSLRRANPTSPEIVIDDVPDGSFDLFIDGVVEGGVRARGVTTIEVRGQDLHDVRVSLQPAQEIAGRVLSADSSGLPSLVGVTVLLGTRRESVDARGTFAISSVLAGHHAVAVDGLPPEAYVADIRYGGVSLHETARSVDGPELEAGLATTFLEIVVDTNGGAIDGVVDGRQAAAGATIVLVPASSRRFIPSYYKTAIAGHAGDFSFKGVPPGVYQLFAWDSVPDTAWLNPQFLSRWEGRGQSVSVAPGVSISVAARLLHREN